MYVVLVGEIVSVNMQSDANDGIAKGIENMHVFDFGERFCCLWFFGFFVVSCVC